MWRKREVLFGETLKIVESKTKRGLYRIFARFYPALFLFHPVVISNIQLTNIFDSSKRVFIMNGKSRVTIKRAREQGEQIFLCLMALHSLVRTHDPLIHDAIRRVVN